jgi:tRNA 2-thiouridine synthesizing protein A
MFMDKTVLNVRGLACPMPIIKTSMLVKKGTAGDEFEITADDPGFEPDIKAWCNETGNALKNISRVGKDITALVVKR